MFKKILLCITLFLVAGCAGKQGVATAESAVASDEKEVSVRAEARWQALIAKDLDKAYEFLSPGSKSAYTLQLYKGMIRPLDWRSGRLHSTRCGGDKCEVKLLITFFHQRAGGELGTVVTETWIKDVGNWWFVFNG